MKQKNRDRVVAMRNSAETQSLRDAVNFFDQTYNRGRHSALLLAVIPGHQKLERADGNRLLF